MERANLELRGSLRGDVLIGGAYVCLKDLTNRVRVMKEGAEVLGSRTKEEPMCWKGLVLRWSRRRTCSLDRTPPGVNRKGKGKKREAVRIAPVLPSRIVRLVQRRVYRANDSISMVVVRRPSTLSRSRMRLESRMEDWLCSNSEALCEASSRMSWISQGLLGSCGHP